MDPIRQRRRLLVALFATAVSTQSPSPLLLRYTDALDLGALVLTLFFAAYAVGLVPSLLLAGPLSDRDGRRRVVVGGVVAALACTLVLIAADAGGVAFLVAGRVAQGLASGAVFTVGTVWLRELSGGDDDGAPGRVRRAAAVASAAMAAGFAVGPLVAGLLVQWGPAPELVSLLPSAVLLLVGLLGLRGVPETMTDRRPGRLALGVPPVARRAFWAYLLPVGLTVYTYAVLSLTVFPLLVAGAGFDAVFALVGASALLVQGSAALVTPLAAKLGPAVSGPLAAVLAACGCGLGYLAVQPGGWPWVLPACLLIGLGEGLGMTSGVAVCDRVAPPDRRGALLSAFYLPVYAGFVVPTVLALVSGDALRGGVPILVLGAGGLLLGLVLAGPGRAALRAAGATTAVPPVPPRVVEAAPEL
ncbi:MFS transporter [Klenkia marina]|uniref:MFS transporter n=1 Tax=Klenkia marina TaxID=1960309 RepID=UPI001401F676|nr:MFS transporter [Klenkia marina]